MIELNSKTKKDFLGREWMEKLIEAGIDTDGKYVIGKDGLSKNDDNPDTTDYVWYKDSVAHIYNVCPTFTVSELLHKLQGYIYPTIEGTQYHGSLHLMKDVPYYPVYYMLMDDEGNKNTHLRADFESPIESLAALLILCHKHGI